MRNDSVAAAEKNLKELMHSKSVGNKRIVELEALLVQESEAIKSLTMQCDDMKKAHKLSQTEMGRRYQDLFEAKEALDKENAVELLTAGKKRKSLESEMQQAKHELVARLDEANETQRVLQLRVTELTDQLKTTKSDLEGQLQQLSDTHDSHVKQSTAAAVITKKRVEALEAELQGSKDELSAHMTECTQQQRISTAKIAELQTKLEKTEWELRGLLQGMTDERDDLLSNYTGAQRKIKTLEADLSAAQVTTFPPLQRSYTYIQIPSLTHPLILLNAHFEHSDAVGALHVVRAMLWHGKRHLSTDHRAAETASVRSIGPRDQASATGGRTRRSLAAVHRYSRDSHQTNLLAGRGAACCSK